MRCLSKLNWILFNFSHNFPYNAASPTFGPCGQSRLAFAPVFKSAFDTSFFQNSCYPYLLPVSTHIYSSKGNPTSEYSFSFISLLEQSVWKEFFIIEYKILKYMMKGWTEYTQNTPKLCENFYFLFLIWHNIYCDSYMNDKGISEIFWVLGDLSRNMFVDTTVRHSSSSVLDRQTECCGKGFTVVQHSAGNFGCKNTTGG